MAEVARTLGRILLSIVWLAILLIVAWPVAYFCAAWWVFFLPFEPLAAIVRDLNALLYKLVLWPKQLAVAILEGSDRFPNPFRDSSYSAI